MKQCYDGKINTRKFDEILHGRVQGVPHKNRPRAGTCRVDQIIVI